LDGEIEDDGSDSENDMFLMPNSIQTGKKCLHVKFTTFFLYFKKVCVNVIVLKKSVVGSAVQQPCLMYIRYQAFSLNSGCVWDSEACEQLAGAR
jgi:hypothetical protein